MKLSNIHADSITRWPGEANGRFALGWDCDGARFHVWCDLQTKEPEDTLYKNPPLGTPYGGEGYFNTRQLDLNSKPSQAMYRQAKAYADEHDMLGKALAAEDAKQQQEQAAREEMARITRIKEAGVDLYAALQHALDELNRIEASNNCVRSDVTYAALKALRKAEGKS